MEVGCSWRMVFSILLFIDYHCRDARRRERRKKEKRLLMDVRACVFMDMIVVWSWRTEKMRMVFRLVTFMLYTLSLFRA